MTAAQRPVAQPPVPPVPLPGGRTLLGWWRELAGYQPQRLWFAHFALHRVEAVVEVIPCDPLDSLRQALLRTVARAGRARLAELQPLDPVLLAQLLHDLSAPGLVRPAPAEAGAWELTEAGRNALDREAFGPGERQRRVFYFAEDSPGQPRYLPLAGGAAPLPPPEGWAFDPAVLAGCVGQAPAWKARHRFPAEVRQVVRGEEDAVILDRAEQVLLALVQVAPQARPAGQAGGGGAELLGFAVRADGWVLCREAPVLTLGEGWREGVPGLAEEPTAEEWRQAWQAWCQPRSLPRGEVQACGVEADPPRLLVRAPAGLVERLRLARSDALKGEAWLLAGSAPRTRAAALIELVEG